MKLAILSLLFCLSTLCFGSPSLAPKLLVFESKVPAPYRASFIAQVNETSFRLGIKPDWLMVVMCFETAGTFKANVKNKYSGATGLIQFIPSTAKRLGTTVNQLGRMSAVEQLAYVEKYFEPYAGQMRSVYDCYIVVFAPAFLGHPDEQVLYSANGPTSLDRKRYRYNRILDANRDGLITVADVKKQIRSFVPTNV